MPTIKLFLQFEGNRRIELIQLDPAASVRDIVAAAVRVGFPGEHKEEAHVFLHDSETPLDPGGVISAAGVRDKDRVHVSRCKKLEVTVHFNDVTKKYEFPPATTVEKVKREFVKDIRMSPTDASEHVLQLCGSTERPEPDLHIGALVSGGCAVCFDLVPIKRIEG